MKLSMLKDTLEKLLKLTFAFFLITAITASTHVIQVSAAENGQTSETFLASHFYKFKKSILEIPGGSTFISNSTDENSILALGINQADNFKTAQNAVYPVSLLFSQDLLVTNLKDLDLREFALSGMRVLDFEYIGKTRFGFNAVISFSRNHGGGTFLCRDMIVLGINLSVDPKIEHKIVRKIFQTGCVPSNSDTNYILWNVLEQSGGQVVVKKVENAQKKTDLELILTVGDFKVLSKNQYLLNQKGINSGEVLGSIVKINVGDMKQNDSNLYVSGLTHSAITSRCATGIRNSQGLSMIRSSGKSYLAATSHGPRGGDTLMIFDCRKKLDYGWPKYSLGTSYSGKLTDRANNIQNEGAVPIKGVPSWSWTPSIGPSSLVQVREKGKFSRWWTDSKNGTQDLLVSGMAAKSLFRLRMYEGKVIGVESIGIGERCRSLVETTYGSLLCGLDSNKLLILNYDSEWNSDKGF